MHLIPPLRKRKQTKNIRLKDRLISICIAVIKIVPIFREKNVQKLKYNHSFLEYPWIYCVFFLVLIKHTPVAWLALAPVKIMSAPEVF